MTDVFDPYLEWLDIPVDGRPPNYYALLGVKEFEEDLAIIEESFGDRYSVVRRYQVGEHGTDALKILQEMSKAYDCLTSPHHKKQYDRSLRSDDPQQSGDVANGPDAASKQQDDELAQFADEPTKSEKEKLPTLEILDGPAAPTLEILGPGPQVDPPVLQPVAPLQAAIQVQAPAAIWFVQTPDGRRLGPATQGQLDDAVAQRRLNPQSVIWREGWGQPSPATQVFPQLQDQSAANGGDKGPLKPYQGIQLRPETAQSRKAIFFVVLVMGLAAAAAAVFLNFAFTLAFMLMGFAGLLGVVAMLAGLLEFGPLLNSPLGEVFRRKMGDEPTRLLFSRIGAMCVLVSFSMIALQGVTVMSRRLSVVSRRMGMPAFANIGGSAPQREGPADAAARGNQPRIQGFSRYQIRGGDELTVTGSGLGNVTRVVFAQPGNAKSSSSALNAVFKIVNERQLSITAPRGLRFGDGPSWICEVHSNGGVAISLPPKTIHVDGPNTPVPPGRSSALLAVKQSRGSWNRFLFWMEKAMLIERCSVASTPWRTSRYRAPGRRT